MKELERERDETIRKLRDPVAVHVAMLRGEIAVPPLAELLHVYGATFNDLDAANAELAKARETIRQLRARAVNAEADNGQLTQGATLSPKERIEFGKLVVRLGVRNVIARLRERDQLRAQLDEYERAPTVATVRFDYDMFVNDRHWDYLDYDDPLPPVGTELIARPARKGE